MKKSMVGMAALVMMTAAAVAGPGSPGDDLVSACVTDEGLVVTAFSTRGQEIVDAAEAKLAQLDAAGATDEKLTLEANKFQAKLLKLQLGCEKVANKTAQKCFVRLANLDESGLVQQITDADAARDDAIDDIVAGADTFSDAISTALANELGD